MCKTNTSNTIVDNMTNNTNRSEMTGEMGEFPVDTRIAATVVPLVFGLILVSGVIGNGSIICIVYRYRRMRTVPNVLIVSLAIGDLILVLVSAPFSAFIYLFDSWYFGEVICKVNEFMQTMSVGVSVFTLAALTVDRYKAVTVPMDVYTRSIHGKIIKSVITVWVVSMILAIPEAVMTSLVSVTKPEGDVLYFCQKFPYDPLWYHKAQVISHFTLYFVIPMCVIVVCYVIIARTLSRTTVRSTQRRTVKTKATRLVLYFVVMFVICWSPRHAYLLWHHLTDGDFNLFWYIFKIIGFCLSFMNSCVNPIVLYVHRCFCDLFLCRPTTSPNNVHSRHLEMIEMRRRRV